MPASTDDGGKHPPDETCSDCGKRAPTLDHLLRHRIRECPGHINSWKPWTWAVMERAAR